MAKSNTEMGERHARDVNTRLGMTHMPGSGNQFQRQTDGRHEVEGIEYRFAQDSKSTKRDSISIKFSDWDKVIEQAHGLRPLMPIRRYGADNLMVITHDLVLVTFNDFADMWDDAERYQDLCR